MDPMHLLVLERDPVRRDALLAALRGAGHRAVAAPDAAAAAAALGAPGFDALVLDLGLPDLDSARLREALVPGEPAAPDSLEAAERRHIALVLQHTGGNKRRAALLLGISRSTLLHKVRKYGLAVSALLFASGMSADPASALGHATAGAFLGRLDTSARPLIGGAVSLRPSRGAARSSAHGTMRTRPSRETTTVRTAAPRLRRNEALLKPMLIPTGEKVMRRWGPASVTLLAAGPGTRQRSTVVPRARMARSAESTVSSMT